MLKTKMKARNARVTTTAHTVFPRAASVTAVQDGNQDTTVKITPPTFKATETSRTKVLNCVYEKQNGYT